MAELTFDTNFDPRHGRLVSIAPGISRLVAPNTGPYTFTGTNTYLIGEERLVIVDPGPKLEAHAEALTEAIADRKVAAIILTHSHEDHAGLARIVQNRVDCPYLSAGAYAPMRPLRPLELDPMRFSHVGGDPDFILQAGDRIESDGPALVVVPTPGHTGNHIALAVEGTEYLLTGDHVMGWSTSVVSPPDGDMADYMRSLGLLLQRDDAIYWPTHGGPVRDTKPFIAAFIAHRREREAAILACLHDGTGRIRDMVPRIYGNTIPQQLYPAAARSVFAHIIDLAERGLIAADHFLQVVTGGESRSRPGEDDGAGRRIVAEVAERRDEVRHHRHRQRVSNLGAVHRDRGDLSPGY